jgi:hypothetical protein
MFLGSYSHFYVWYILYIGVDNYLVTRQDIPPVTQRTTQNRGWLHEQIILVVVWSNKSGHIKEKNNKHLLAFPAIRQRYLC